MEEIKKEKLKNYFLADEGSINMYYGRIGNGKTYSATSDIIKLLKQGKVVYANWKIKLYNFDDRKNIYFLIRNIFLYKKYFFEIPCKDNFHYFDPTEYSKGELINFLSNLNNCYIFYDEGQDIFDSYEGTGFSKAKRRLILHTRHYNRTINIISQRPTAIQVSARANVNKFYKCVKLSTRPWPRFARLEYQDMIKDTVNEDIKPISIKTYWASKKIFNAYNTHYLGESSLLSQKLFFKAYKLSFKEKIFSLLTLFKKKYSIFISLIKRIKK